MAEKKSYFANLITITKATVSEWWEADPFRQSAIVAYYAVFSIPALLVIVVAIAGLVFGQDAVRGEISQQIQAALGEDTAEQIENIISKASEEKTSIFATVIGFLTLIIGSTAVFSQLQHSLNHIWEVEVVPTKQWLRTLKTRLFSFGLVLSLGFLTLVSLLLTAGLEALSGMIKDRLPDFMLVVFWLLNFLLSFSVITILFGLIFKILPDAKIRLRDVWIGAMVTTSLFLLGKFALGIYFAEADPGGVYGAAGSIVLIMLWVSYSCMILFLGAEFTKQYATFHGHQVKATIESKVVGPKKEKTETQKEKGEERMSHRPKGL